MNESDLSTLRSQFSAPALSGAAAKVPNQAFQSVLDHVPGAWFFTRYDGTFAYVNQGAATSLAYPRADLANATIFDIDPMMSPEIWHALWADTPVLDSRTILTRHRRRDGSEFPVEVRCSRVMLEGEDLAASYTIDLTASEKTQVALVETEAQLQRLLERLPDLVFQVRLPPDAVFEFVSPSVQSLLGYAPAELVGTADAVRQVVYRADWESFEALGQTPAGTDCTIRFVHRDGHLVWMALRASRLAKNSAGPVLEGVARDITHSRNAELINRRLLAAIEQANEAVVVTDARGHVEYVNPAYVRSTGRAEDEVRGKPWLELEARHDAGLTRAFADVLASGAAWQGRIESQRTESQRTESQRTESQRTDGQTYNEDVSLSPMRDEAGQVVGCVAVKRDVTEQLRLEQQLLQAQRIKAVGQLAGGIAHDFNNLLQVIYAQTQLVSLRSTNGALQPMLQEIHKAVERATNLVRQLMAFSRKGTVDFSDVRLDQLVSLMHQMLQPLLGAQIEIQWVNTAGAAHVRGNAPQLEQVVANLCINARDAMPYGGTLSLKLESVAPELVPRRDRAPAEVEHVLLSVSDNGVGMDSGVQSHLFEPFFTTKEPGKGTGLGLATVHAVIEAHSGFIEVSSSPGDGSTFHVYLPRIVCASLDAAPQRRSCHVEGRDRWVLVAEDEPAVRELSVACLERAGFRVLSAKDGVEADAHLCNPEYDVRLAVLDAVMPRRGGQAVRAGLRERGQDVPILFVTGYDFESLAGAVSQPGVAILQKPFSAEELLTQVAHLLGEADTGETGAVAADVSWL